MCVCVFLRACAQCDNGYEWYYDGGPCIKVPEPTCYDGVKNGLEFGVDCGQLAGCKACGGVNIQLPKVCRAPAARRFLRVSCLAVGAEA
ncbi:MAG: hypothetical protein P4L40_18490 [Terracidiphilus sp.]|nr:hypothetical protein [Terracidiphilus sp.]